MMKQKKFIPKARIYFYIPLIIEQIRIIITNICFIYLLFVPSRQNNNPASGIKKILLINTGDLGDNILTFKFITALNNSPDYKVYLLIRHNYFDLYKLINKKIKVFLWDRTNYRNNIIYKIRFLSAIRECDFDIAFNITPERGILNEELTLLSNAKNIWRIKKKERFILQFFKGILDAKYSRIFCCKALNEYTVLDEIMTQLGVTASEKYYNPLIKSRNKGNICIAPFSSDKERDWKLDNYKVIISKLSEKYTISLLGTKEQLKYLQGYRVKNVTSLVGMTDFHELFNLISSSALFIGNDSGLSHLALYLDTPMIAITGGGMYSRFFPHMENRLTRFFAFQMHCFLCEWKCRFKERYCITSIKAEEVLIAAKEILNDNKT